MRKALVLVLAVVFAATVVGCTTVVVKEDKGPEILLPAKFVESVDANTVSLRCEGIGPDQNAAILQARKACIDWYITNKLAPKASERKSYEAVQQDIFAKLDRFVGHPPPGARDGQGPGVKSRTRISEDKIRVEIIVHVQKKLLQDELVAMGVMQSTEDLMAAVGQPHLMAVPGKASKSSKLRPIMETLVMDYATSQDLEMKDPKNASDMDKFTTALGEVKDAEEGEAAQLALALGADVYFVYEALKDKKGDTINYSVRVKAFETVTSTVLGAKEASAPARYDDVAGQESKALREPLNDAMGKLMPEVMRWWKNTAPKGPRFRVQFNGGEGNKVKNEIYKLLKMNCSAVKMITFVPGEKVAFEAQCKKDNMEMSMALEEAVPAKLGTGMEWITVTRSCLLGKIQ